MEAPFQIFSLALIGISLIIFLLNYIRFRSWIVATGVVVGMEEKTDEDGFDDFRPVIMFTHDKYGKQVFKTGIWTKYTWLKGDLIEVIYDQSKIGSAKVNRIYFKYSDSINMGLFGLFVFIWLSW